MKQTSTITEPKGEGKTIIDYSGKTLYVGIDVHKKSWQVGILCEGLVLGNHAMPADAGKLIDFFGRRYPEALLRCVYESSAWGFNLLRSLRSAGIDCIVVHAADVPGSDKERKNKTDKVDALRLARYHACGELDAIHVPDVTLQQERNLIRFRKRLLWDLQCSKNRIKSLLKFQGIDVPAKLDNSSWSNHFISWLKQQAAVDPLLGCTLDLMLEQVILQRQLLLKTEKRLRELMKSERYQYKASLLMGIPGIGILTTAVFLLEIGDVERFKSFDQLNNFIGLYPERHSSGETDKVGPISNRRHNDLRSMLIEASWQAIRRDPALLEAYQQLTKRMKPTEAIIRIARKMLRRIRRVLVTQQPYQLGVMAG